MGRIVVSEGDRRDIKKARKEGRLAEAMLDRRAALKRSVMILMLGGVMLMALVIGMLSETMAVRCILNVVLRRPHSDDEQGTSHVTTDLH